MSDTRSLPLIPLEDGIVLPGMAFVFELVSPDANVAVDEVGSDGHVVLVPKVDGRFARVGVVALWVWDVLRVDSRSSLSRGRGTQR